jgi:undecaprenyl-phosphate 4-deoxy-4-formamido-L-arabinose transferase
MSASGAQAAGAGAPDVSVVIPVYNEESGLAALFERLYPVLDALGRPVEVVFVDDGSRDRSPALLRQQFQQRPDVTRVVLLRANAGQHAAILAAFEHVRGRYVITMDADLQNPPEELPRLVAEMDAGHDYVGSIRRQRRDAWWRHWASRLMNAVRQRITSIRMTDQGCMLRGYHRDIVRAVLHSREAHTFIPALAYLYAANPTEIPVEHSERFSGQSKYPLYKLIHLNFDLITGFSVLPLQLFSLIGMGIATLSVLFVIYLAIRRLMIGPEVEGVFTLFAIAFFLIGIALFGIGLLGEYVGRIYEQVRDRPRYLVSAVLEAPDAAASRAGDAAGEPGGSTGPHGSTEPHGGA